MKKRILSLFLVFVLAASLLPCAAFAEGEESVTGSASVSISGDCYPGETLTVTVLVTANPGIYAMFADLTYGSDVEFVSVSASGGGFFRNEEEGSSNPDAIIWVGAPVTVEENGDISIDIDKLAAYTSLTLTYKFKVKDSASVGSTLSFAADLDAGTLTGTGDEVTETGVEIAQASASVTVKEKPYVLGDADGNGVVNMLDVIAIRKYLINSTTYPLNPAEAAEVTGEGTINMLDVVAIRKYLINSTTYPLG